VPLAVLRERAAAAWAKFSAESGAGDVRMGDVPWPTLHASSLGLELHLRYGRSWGLYVYIYVYIRTYLYIYTYIHIYIYIEREREGEGERVRERNAACCLPWTRAALEVRERTPFSLYFFYFFTLSPTSLFYDETPKLESRRVNKWK